jgi:hypothetical protein
MAANSSHFLIIYKNIIGINNSNYKKKYIFIIL